ncbi:MAG: 2-oxoacid:acceptor oxidoreductase family protein, partial [Bacteroidales bacterium]|nr:2-oxoacid:acceptor oxidoreductase family protein [Bacteroidales bacterium]
PEIADVLKEVKSVPNHIAIDAEQIAKDLGSVRSANVVILGASSPFLGIEYEKLEESIKIIFQAKGEKIIQLNLDALKAGKKFSENYR